MQYLAALAATAALSGVTQALNPLAIQGTEFVDTVTGNRFEIIGMDYQPGGSSGYSDTSGTDVLAEPANCIRDAALMQQLGINTIRVYNLNPYLDHDQCVSIFNMAGIYLILDVNTALVNEALDAAAPWTTYFDGYVNRTFAMIDAFSNYPNTMAFHAANELIQSPQNAAVDPPYIRAITRDMKQYQKARGGRQVPIGYSAADYRDVLVDTANYVTCTINGSSVQDNIDSGRTDFFALNSYSWCGDSSFDMSTYDDLVAYFTNTSVPVFFSEYGCNKVEPRTFTEVGAIYGPQMTVFSGGLVYQWTQDSNNFGIVNINSDSSILLMVDYATLQGQLNQIDLSIIESYNASTADVTYTPCSNELINGDLFSASNFVLPTQPPGVPSLIADGAPGRRTGSLVSVTETMVSVMVTTVNSASVSSVIASTLAITSASSANTPSGATGSPTATDANAAAALSSITGTATGGGIPVSATSGGVTSGAATSGASTSGAATAAATTTSASSGAAMPRATGANAALVGAGAAGLFLLALA